MQVGPDAFVIPRMLAKERAEREAQIPIDFEELRGCELTQDALLVTIIGMWNVWMEGRSPLDPLNIPDEVRKYGSGWFITTGSLATQTEDLAGKLEALFPLDEDE
ncbi:hypothetical protein A4X17_18610 [Plantibacter sp. H53]|nr:hypothetical protein A4X17_18610 [Plantibacter sp. H53]